MEIIKKATAGPHKFRVNRGFKYYGTDLQPGETVELKEPEATSLVRISKVTPEDLPEIADYLSLTKIVLPGRTEKFECKKFERISLKAVDALRLMLEGIILPVSDEQWRPNNRKLRQGPDRTAQERARKDRIAFEDKLFKIGIHPAMKKS